jgi:hypothetical protein
MEQTNKPSVSESDGNPRFAKKRRVDLKKDKYLDHVPLKPEQLIKYDAGASKFAPVIFSFGIDDIYIIYIFLRKMLKPELQRNDLIQRRNGSWKELSGLHGRSCSINKNQGKASVNLL